MYYENYYWGMNFFWWIIWVILLFWIFVLPYDIPGQKRKIETPLDILRKRLARGSITKAEYDKVKKDLQED